MTKKVSKPAPKVMKEIKPVSVGLEQRLKTDKVFLLSLLDDPFRTLRAYGYSAEPSLVEMLNGVSSDVLTRAQVALVELARWANRPEADNFCDGCKVCSGTMELFNPGEREH